MNIRPHSSALPSCTFVDNAYFKQFLSLAWLFSSSLLFIAVKEISQNLLILAIYIIQYSGCVDIYGDGYDHNSCRTLDAPIKQRRYQSLSFFQPEL
jgi:hypothetical protein